MDKEQAERSVIVVGGGPAGMMAAIHAAYGGAKVTLFETNTRLGIKLRITGKGRCNVTNDCDREEFLRSVPRNPRFLYAALARFSPADTQNFFELLGVPLKVERGKRVFPVSDRAHDVADALVRQMKDCGVTVRNESVRSLIFAQDGEKKRVIGVESATEKIYADRIILATGGKSYPKTGSTGDGYRFARAAGHTVTDILPSLVPLVAEGSLCKALQGLSLRNVGLRIVETATGREIYEDFGEMLFTHFGLTGPLILSASAHLQDLRPGKYKAVIDLKPALDDKTLDARLISDFEKYRNKDLINALGDLLPQKLIAPMITLSGIPERKKVHEITREERQALAYRLKHLEIKIREYRPIDEAIITRGGVSVKEIDPKTMQSKLCDGLYFAGELLDLDAYTGGFNLQIAFSTAVLAGESAAE